MIRKLSISIYKASLSNPKTLKLVFAASPLHTQYLGVRAKTGRPRVRTMCLSKVACLPVDCITACLACLSEVQSRTSFINMLSF